MAHTFEVISSVCSQLNSLSKEYMGNCKARTMSKIMDSLCISVGRSISAIDDIIIDKERVGRKVAPVVSRVIAQGT